MAVVREIFVLIKKMCSDVLIKKEQLIVVLRNGKITWLSKSKM